MIYTRECKVMGQVVIVNIDNEKVIAGLSHDRQKRLYPYKKCKKRTGYYNVSGDYSLSGIRYGMKKGYISFM